jgi:methylenetetrahydrofolate reductase (NADPH)
MILSLDQMQESGRAIAAPLFAGLPGDAEISFEFFPPKSDKMEEQLWDSVTTLAPLAPRFVSVTYGAGGSTRERTHATVARIVKETGIPAAAHLTCVEASKADIRDVAEAYWEAGVRHIVALRGDPPSEGEVFKPHPEGYESAAALVKGLKDIADFDISVAAYPETHPQADCAQSDIDNLKRKLDAGASRAITQMFFDPEVFFRFRDAAAAAGINQELVPGILPVSNVAQARKFSGMCGVTIPAWMDELYEGLDDHPAARQLVAATLTAEMCRKLYAGGVRHFHFYTLNRAELSYAICHLLGKRAVTSLQEKAA